MRETTSLDDLSKRIQMAHTQVSDRLAAGEDELEAVYALWNDIQKDCQELKGQLTKIGCPRSTDLLTKIQHGLDGMKPTMEEELAKPK